MVERVRNVIKRDNRKCKRPLAESEEPKHPKKRGELLRRYPVNTLSAAEENAAEENADTLERHNKAITIELGKAKPRDSVLLPLMRSTYGERRMFILNEATSVGTILTKHPALCRLSVVC